jgi:hypothetical protein
MSNVTYLLGAGASAQCLPVVKQIPDKLQEFIAFLEAPENSLSKKDVFSTLEGSRAKFIHQSELITDLKELKAHSSSHASIDTYAKKLVIRREFDQLRKLKSCLTCFFSFIQFLTPPDSRYDSFFASIISNDRVIGFPSSLNILSWNYDSQLEISLAEYSGNNTFYQNQSLLNVYPGSHPSDLPPEEEFSVIKLNGTANSIHNKANMMYGPITAKIKQENHFKLTESLVLTHASLSLQSSIIYPLLSFAWEKGSVITDGLNFALQRVKQTETLVVIGYSFPFFNREIDRKVFAAMGSLKKVYIQDTRATELTDKLKGITSSNLEVVPIMDIEEFFLPPEL